uniref:Copper transport protein ATOX1 n=1 Tax=Sparus aurata TaxID=8175 RepID=A0A671UN65_SPAAU
MTMTHYLIRLQQKHEFEVAMTCEGCSGAVTRVLNKLEGVTFEIDLPQKLVWIESDKDAEVLMQTLQKCGKEVKYNGTK